MHKTLALTGAMETSITAAAHQLLELAARDGVQLALLQGVSTAHEAQAVYADSGELWRIGADESKPELGFLVDRWIQSDDMQQLHANIAEAWGEFTGKTRIAA